jgi:hypothetical protein
MKAKCSGKHSERTEPLCVLSIEQPRDLHRSPIIIMILKSMTLKWAGRVARMGVIRNGGGGGV